MTRAAQTRDDMRREKALHYAVVALQNKAIERVADIVAVAERFHGFLTAGDKEHDD